MTEPLGTMNWVALGMLVVALGVAHIVGEYVSRRSLTKKD